MSKRYGQTAKSQNFASTVHSSIQTSTFQRNSTHKTAYDASLLIPLYVDEIIASDVVSMSVGRVARLSTPEFPLMDDLEYDEYWFYAPLRILWDNLKEFFGENTTGIWATDPSQYQIPQFSVTTTNQTDYPLDGSIGDYLGLTSYTMDTSQDVPAPVFIPFSVTDLIKRMYRLIYNEWFRDQNLQAPLIVETNDNQSTGSYADAPLRANKKHDYFTSCLPSPQKGVAPLIPITLQGLIPVNPYGDPPPVGATTGTPLKIQASGQFSQDAYHLIANSMSPGTTTNLYRVSRDLSGGSTLETSADGIYSTNLVGDLSQATGVSVTSISVDQMRMQFAIQRIYEKDARGGTRYKEVIKSHFGVVVADYRSQIPEFLGHHHSYVSMQQVPQTSETTSTSEQGNLAAYSHSTNGGHVFKKAFTEPGYIMCIGVVRSQKIYQQGISKLWTRKDRLDFYHPSLAHISEQPVYKYEIYPNGDTGGSTPAIFGYQEAWADYRYKENRTSSIMRTQSLNSSGNRNTVDAWHLASYFNSVPSLVDAFIQDDTREVLFKSLELQREKQFIADFFFSCKHTRPMPVYSIPGLIDHF